MTERTGRAGECTLARLVLPCTACRTCEVACAVYGGTFGAEVAGLCGDREREREGEGRERERERGRERGRESKRNSRNAERSKAMRRDSISLGTQTKTKQPKGAAM